MKRTFSILLWCTLVSLFTVTCRKEHLSPPAGSSSPVFYFNGLVNGSPVNLQAGIGSYYMYSSYMQDSNQIYNYTGNLKEFGCTSGCANSIEFTIKDYRSLSVGASETNISDSALINGFYNYYVPGGTANEYSETFTTTTSNPTASYTFSFGDGSTVTGGSLPASFLHTYKKSGTYATSLKVSYDSTTGTLTDTLNALASANSNNMNISLQYYTAGGGYVKAIITGGTQPYTVNLNFGDSYTYNNPSLSSNTDSIPHVYPAGLFTTFAYIKDAHGLTASASYNVEDSTTKPYFNYGTGALSPVPNPSAFSNVTIQYTDATGDVYSTADSTAQRPGDNFQLISVSNYQNNVNNQTTKQLHVKFNCTLHDASGKPMTIKNGDAIIAVAYK